ncbi:hypothetical protein KDAU_46630 [Dictyobacter aurantiacus]|uniref:Uncharacterized protein n=1 Tax=Dictyobacter aurantiacus TaxID=1936993 RepID=A0A401ZKJ4_9CHLR|nr:hypothetical protein KDAU_46630 [Dictyobacter aurantiacus]
MNTTANASDGADVAIVGGRGMTTTTADEASQGERDTYAMRETEKLRVVPVTR